MKRIIAYLLALTLFGTAAIPSYAESVSSEDSSSESTLPFKDFDLFNNDELGESIKDNSSEKQELDDSTQKLKDEINAGGADIQSALPEDMFTSTLEPKTDFNAFSEKMDEFLASAGFDYNDFSSQKFELPDMSGIMTQADIKNEYAKVIESFEQYNFGKAGELPKNSGYTNNVIGSFSEKFGGGLASSFSEYQLAFDPNEVFESAQSTRSSLFSSVMSSSSYQAVSQNLDISGVLNKIDSISLTPYSMTSLSDLSSSIKKDFDYTTRSNKATNYTANKNYYSYKFGLANTDDMQQIKDDFAEKQADLSAVDYSSLYSNYTNVVISNSDIDPETGEKDDFGVEDIDLDTARKVTKMWDSWVDFGDTVVSTFEDIIS